MTSDDNTERAWLASVYDTSIADVRWAKEQSWRAAEWSLVLNGAILALYRYPFQRVAVGVFVVISLALAALFTYYLWRLHTFAAASRSRTDDIKHLMPKSVQGILGERGHDPNHVFFFGVQITTIWCSFGLVCAGLKWIHGTLL